MGKLIGNVKEIEWAASNLDNDIKKLQEVAQALEAVHKSLAGNQALVELGYAHAVASKRTELLRHIHQLESCSKTMYQAAVLYHDFENYALGALEGKSPKEVILGDDEDEGPREKKTFETTVRVRSGDVTITAHNDGLLNAIVARPIARIVFWAKDVPWDPDEYVSVGEAISDYFDSTVNGGAGIGRKGEDGSRTAGAYGSFGGSLFSNEMTLQIGDDRNNKHFTAGLDILPVSAEAGAEVSNKDDSYAGWNFGVSVVKGRLGGGVTDDGAKLDVAVEGSLVSASSENKGRINTDKGDMEYGVGLSAMAGLGFRVKGENLMHER